MKFITTLCNIKKVIQECVAALTKIIFNNIYEPGTTKVQSMLGDRSGAVLSLFKTETEKRESNRK